MPTAIKFPKGDNADDEKPRKSKGGGSSTGSARKPRAGTSDKFSPSQNTWGQAPVDWCVIAFETLNPIQLNKSRTTGINRNACNAVWFKAIGALPNQRVFDQNSKPSTLTTCIHEHAALGYPLQGATLESIIKEMEEKIGITEDIVEDENEKVYSIHPGDNGRFYISDGTRSEWMNNGDPVAEDAPYEIFKDDSTNRWYVANHHPGSSKWLDEAPFFPPKNKEAASQPPAPPVAATKAANAAKPPPPPCPGANAAQADVSPGPTQGLSLSKGF
jgi:cell division septation protein DedD